MNNSPESIAKLILEGFERHYSVFRANSRKAKEKFENGDYAAIRELLSERISYYDQRVRETSESLEKKFGQKIKKDVIWPDVKKAFIMLLTDHKQPELAESFFNSITTQLLDRIYFKNSYLFVRPAISTEYLDSKSSSYNVYYPLKQGIKNALGKIILDIGLSSAWEDIKRDTHALLRKSLKNLKRPFRPTKDLQIHILKSLFFRNKGAYLIGRLVMDGDPMGFAVPILRSKNGFLFLDTIIFENENLTLLFSFSRAYFMVDMEVPAAYVSFLKSLMPSKPTSEIYTMLGLQKQGKTLFYRDLLQHLNNSTDKFTIADGIKGLVMLVFTLPSFPYVFKIIKDLRDKEVTREHITNRYQLVKHHDRVGRMADTWEYSNVDFPLERFEQELLEGLRKYAPSMLEQVEDRIIIKHVYIERRMTPLNIFLENASDGSLNTAMKEYGNALKELISANIFPGDLLYKNFGLTKNGRVVFYDYDEIQYITECNFRKVPTAINPEDELSDEPWYAIGKNDVFPEEFETFLLSKNKLKNAFLKHHSNLLDPNYWLVQQDKIQKGDFVDIFPYSNEERFFPDKKVEQ